MDFSERPLHQPLRDRQARAHARRAGVTSLSHFAWTLHGAEVGRAGDFQVLHVGRVVEQVVHDARPLVHAVAGLDQVGFLVRSVHERARTSAQPLVMITMASGMPVWAGWSRCAVRRTGHATGASRCPSLRLCRIQGWPSGQQLADHGGLRARDRDRHRLFFRPGSTLAHGAGREPPCVATWSATAGSPMLVLVVEEEVAQPSPSLRQGPQRGVSPTGLTCENDGVPVDAR